MGKTKMMFFFLHDDAYEGNDGALEVAPPHAALVDCVVPRQHSQAHRRTARDDELHGELDVGAYAAAVVGASSVGDHGGHVPH